MISLAWKNVKTNFKNYGIYLLTLTFSVALFYAFNSIESQKVLLNLNDNMQTMFQHMSTVVHSLSIVLAFILSFLFIYMNQYFIRERAKEFAIYLTLGISKRKLSLLLTLETLFMGAVSLVAGLGLGFLLSQLLAVLSSHLLQMSYSHFQFIFSKDSFLTTILLFSCLFLSILLFNFLSLRKITIRSLMNQNKEVKPIKMKAPFWLWLSVGVGFVLLIGDISFVFLFPVEQTLSYFPWVLGSGILATIFLFIGAIPLLLQKIQRTNWYYKGTHTFLIRQWIYQYKESLGTLITVTLVLFFSIAALATGLGLNSAMNQALNFSDRFPVSGEGIETAKFLQKSPLTKKALDDITYIPYYHNKDWSYSFFVKEDKVADAKKINSYLFSNQGEYNQVSIIPLSKYNQAQNMVQGQKISLSKHQYALVSDMSNLNSLWNTQKEITWKGKVYQSKKEVYRGNIKNMTSNVTTLLVVFPDEALMNEKVTWMSTVAKIKNEKEYHKLQQSIDHLPGDQKYIIQLDSKKEIREGALSLGFIISFLAIYVGVLLTFSTVTILSVQQLTNINKTKYRYQLLQKLGVSDKESKKTLYMQIRMSFLCPLFVSLIYVAIAYPFIIKILSVMDLASFNFKIQFLFALLILILIYYLYYFLTKSFAWKNVKEQKRT